VNTVADYNRETWLIEILQYPQSFKEGRLFNPLSCVKSFDIYNKIGILK